MILALTIAELLWVLAFMESVNCKPRHTAPAIKTWATGLYFSSICEGFT